MELIEQIIEKMEQNLLKAHAANNRFLFGYYAHDQIDQLKALPDPMAGLEAILKLIERNPEVYYEHYDIPLCPYLESFYKSGLEGHLLLSLQRNPAPCTVYMLDWLLADKEHPQHLHFLKVMKEIGGNPQLPEAVRKIAQDSIALYDDQNQVREVHPGNYQLLSLEEAIRRFDLETLYHRDGSNDLLTHSVDETARVILFEGDTEFIEDINIYHTQNKLEKVPSHTSGFEMLLYGERYLEDRVLVINGNLKARNIGMSNINALFVFGNLDCEKIEFGQSRPVFILGNLHASKAILARGLDDDDFALEHRGANNACIQGWAFAPRVQTWYMHLSHLNWKENSGKEFAEDVELDHWQHLNDGIWSMKSTQTE